MQERQAKERHSQGEPIAAAETQPPTAADGATAADYSTHFSRLRWQSRAVLLLVVPAAGVWLALLWLQPWVAWARATGAIAGASLALLVWRAHAGTAAGAALGGLLLACLCLSTPGWHSSAWPLVAMLVLSLGATRAGRAGRRVAGEDEREQRHGRNAAQVAANLGVAVLAGTLVYRFGQVAAHTALLAALAEAAADTMASELGQAFAGQPRLLTTWRPVPPGTNGGITLAGTAVGAAGALIVAMVGVYAMGMGRGTIAIAAGAGGLGLLFDSLLGATLEDAGWLNNDAVNFLSTLFAAAVALLVVLSRP